MHDGRESRPAGDTTEPAQSISTASQAAVPILAPSILTHPRAVIPAYALLVLRGSGAIHRQVFVSLHSAQAAMDRAAAKGLQAKCVLVELVPVPAAPAYVVGGDHR